MSKKGQVFKKITVREQCIIAMLIAVTVVLSYVSGYLRIGNIGKLSVSFVSVYVAAAMFGPLVGGLVGAAADFLSWAVNPASGVYLWQLTVIEFAYGFIFGLFFYRKNGVERTGLLPLRIFTCVLLQFISNTVIKALVLMNIGYLPESFTAAFLMRVWICVITAVLQILIIFVMEKFIPVFLKYKNK